MFCLCSIAGNRTPREGEVPNFKRCCELQCHKTASSKSNLNSGRQIARAFGRCFSKIRRIRSNSRGDLRKAAISTDILLQDFGSFVIQAVQFFLLATEVMKGTFHGARNDFLEGAGGIDPAHIHIIRTAGIDFPG